MQRGAVESDANEWQINFRSSFRNASELVTMITIPNIKRTLHLGALLRLIVACWKMKTWM